MERIINGKLYELIGIDKHKLKTGDECNGCAFDLQILGKWCGQVVDDTCCDEETETQEFIWKLKRETDGRDD
jgi:hypothetical protein